MMELDELRQVWAQYDRKLDVSIRLNQQLLSAAKVSKAGSAMRRFALFAGVEAAITLAVIVALGSFIYEQRGTRGFALPGVALDAGAIVILSQLIRQMIAAFQVDYEQPVALVQKRLEALRVMHIRYIRNICLAAALAWAPLLIVALRALWGVDAYEVFSASWLIANVALGAAIALLGLWISKIFGSRLNRHPLMQRFMNDLAGYNLNAAAKALAGIAEFEDAAIR